MTHYEILNEWKRSIKRVQRTPDRLPQRESMEITMRRMGRIFVPARIVRGDGYILVKKTT
jgi:hypothetical protein